MTDNISKKAILLFSFGTAENNARCLTLDAIEADVCKAFPNYEVRHTYTSPTVRKILRSRENIAVDSPDEAFEKLLNDGFTDIYCQPTYFMCGYEYDMMLETVNDYKKRFNRITAGFPLVYDTASCNAFAAVMNGIISDNTKAYVFVGHGTTHPSNTVYSELEACFRENGRKNVFVGTIEASPDFDCVAEKLKTAGYGKVTLLPLLICAGVHAREDIFGGDNSWKNRLEKLNYDVDCLPCGLGEYIQIRVQLLNKIDFKENSK